MTTILENVTTQIEKRARLPLTLWALREQSILYIEDVPADIEITKNELGKYKLNVIGGWGKSLKKLVRGQRIGVAIVDHLMPDGTSGFQLLSEIREEIGQHIPAIGYSAVFHNYTQCQVVAKKYNEKIVRYVRKPSRKDSLLNAICSALWASIKSEFRRLVLEEIRVNFPILADAQVIAREPGKVINITGDVSVVQFRSEEEEIRLQFPNWRLEQIGADELNSKVEHLVLKIGTQVISDLRSTDILPRAARSTGDLDKLTPKIERDMKKAEKQAEEQEDGEN